MVFNWDLVSAVNIDVSGVGLQIGDQYEVRDPTELLIVPGSFMSLLRQALRLYL
jgi:hypothetical protein